MTDRRISPDGKEQATSPSGCISPAASERAEALLLAHLSAEQRRQYESARCFRVVAASGTEYWIFYGRTSNIVANLLCAGEAVQYCIQPANPALPIEDVLLAQKLLIESDERQFLRIANRRE